MQQRRVQERQVQELQVLAPQPRNFAHDSPKSVLADCSRACVMLLLVSKAIVKDTSSMRLFNSMLDRAKTVIRTLKQALNQMEQDLVVHPT